MSATLTDLCSAIVDCEHKTAPEGDGYAVSVGTRAMKNGRLVLGACKPVSKKTFGLWTRRLMPACGDLILAREAPVGDVVRVPSEPRVCLGQRTVLIRPNPDCVDPRFLHYWLLGPVAQEDMRARAAGATVPHLNVEDIRALDVSAIPENREFQKTIGSVLGVIDDLIENNRRRIALLEQMAQAIYREWFVHFRYPGHEDDELIDSPLGPIPPGWRVARLNEVATLQRSNIRPGDAPSDEFEHFSIPNFDALRLPAWEQGETIRSGKYAVTEPCVLVSKLNPRIRRVWLATPSTVDRSVASTEFLVLRPRTWSLELLYLAASSEPFQEQVVGLAGGTSTSHQRATPGDFMALEVADPPAELALRAAQAFAPMVNDADALRRQSARVAAMRDLLLPKLVTGAIDVSHLDIDPLLARSTLHNSGASRRPPPMLSRCFG